LNLDSQIQVPTNPTSKPPQPKRIPVIRNNKKTQLYHFIVEKITPQQAVNQENERKNQEEVEKGRGVLHLREVLGRRRWSCLKGTRSERRVCLKFWV